MPQYLDDQHSDTFVLSGAEDLVPYLDAALEPIVTDETLLGQTYRVNRYRPRIEGEYARIERWVDPIDRTSFWRVTSGDNVTSYFGRTAGSRIVDPAAPRRVFQWLLDRVEDDRGNVTDYIYKAEDDEGVTTNSPWENARPRGSAPQRYLKRIRYGNRTPLAQSGAAIDATDFCFEVVFDYGEHGSVPSQDEQTSELLTVSFDEQSTWPAREDAFSSFRSTFDLRTHRLCRRVLVFHRFAELLPSPQLTSSLDLYYEASSVTTLLRAATRRGYEPDGSGTYRAEAVPPVRLEYTSAQLQPQLQVDNASGLEDLHQGIDGAQLRLVDLDGEGAPGLLWTHGRTWKYKRAVGDAGFARGQVLRDLPSTGTAQARLMDLDGNGRLSLTEFSGPAAGTYERTDGGWGLKRPLRTRPTADINDAYVRMVDIDGDGLADVLVDRGDSFEWYPSRGRDGFGPSVRVNKPRDETNGPQLVYGDPWVAIFHADMTGDGLADLVRVGPRSVVYWPNRGYGKFGPRIVMGAVPPLGRSELFSAQRVRLADIDGSGTADLVVFDERGAFVCLNAAGNRFTAAQRLRGVPPLSSVDYADVADIDGLGYGSLVWSSSRTNASALRVVRLLPHKPYLLNQVNNGFGGETRVSYASSTRFAMADRAAGRPWITTLPFPVQVIDRVEVHDRITGHRFVSTYDYHHGYFDGPEREFRGFGLVEQRDTERFDDFSEPRLFATGHRVEDEALHVPPVLTRSWFHVGQYLGHTTRSQQHAQEYWVGDPQAELLADTELPIDLSPQENREAIRALKGTALRVEVYAEDGTEQAGNPYVVTETSFAVRREQAQGGNAHAVFAVFPRETLAYHYEREPADPRVTHELVLEVDAFGVPVRSATVAYPRRVTTRTEQSFTAVVLSESTVVHQPFGVDRHRLGVPVEQRTWELSGVLPAASRFSIAELLSAFGAAEVAFDVDQPADPSVPLAAWPAVPPSPRRRVLSRAQTVYWADDLTAALPLGQAGRRALPFDTRTAVLSEAQRLAVFGVDVSAALLSSVTEGGYLLDDGLWWAQGGRTVFDPSRFYQPVSITDPFGGQSTVVYDAASLFVTQATDPLGNTSTAQIDYRVLAPREVTDANDNVTQAAFDTLGMVTAVAALGKPGIDVGDSLAGPDTPTLRHFYDQWAAYREQGPTWSRAEQRELHGAANTRWHSTVTYSDGLGRAVQQKVQAEPGADGAPRWVGTGRTIVDNKGNPIKQYEPYFAASDAFETEEEIVAQGVTPLLHYDPLGRLIRTDLPDGTLSRVEFSPWEQMAFDAGDTVMESAWREARLDAGAEPLDQRALALSERYADTPTTSLLDTLGRPFEVDAHNRVLDGGVAVDSHAVTRTRLDIAGNASHVIDARDNVAQAQIFGMGGQVLATYAVDVGIRRSVTNVLGQPLRGFDARGHVHRAEYDAARRPTHHWVDGIAGAAGEVLVTRTVYGEALPVTDALAANLRGRTWRVYDGAGLVTAVANDFDGNAIEQSRQLVADSTVTIDWSALAGLNTATDLDAAAAATLTTEVFTTTASFNAFGLPIAQTTPDLSTTSHTYNNGFLLEAVSVNHRGAVAATPIVTHIDYDSQRRRSSIGYGNGTETTYTYDPLSFRLTRLQTTRPASGGGTENVQDLRYFYDAVGNITDTRDDAQQTVFFNNAVIEPHQAFEYDALYRLVVASGREHVSLGQPANTEHPAGPLPNPNDPQALRTYVERYEYDSVGNILRMQHEAVGGSWTRRYDYATDGNRLLATSVPGDGPGVHSAVYAYNNHGSMSAMPHLAAVDWDHAEQMRHADLGGGGDVWFVYDSAGQRVRKVQVNAAGSTTSERIYLGEYEVYREHVGGALDSERQTLHVADDGGRVCMLETLTVDDGVEVAGAANTSRYQYSNHLGSVGLELDGSGQLISYEEFHPYGSTAYRATNSAIEVSASRYRYTGQERDEETGLGHHGARYYAGWLGRWTSADPIGLGDGVNRYAYVSNRPTRLRDPNGTQGLWDRFVDAQTAAIEGLAAAGDAVSDAYDAGAEGLHDVRQSAIEHTDEFVSEHLWDEAGDFASGYVSTVSIPLEVSSELGRQAAGAVGTTLTAPKRLDEGVQVLAQGIDTGNDVMILDGLGQSVSAGAEIAGTVAGGASKGLNAVKKGVGALAQLSRKLPNPPAKPKPTPKAERRARPDTSDRPADSGNTAKGRVPHGFASADEFAEFGADLTKGLKKAGITDATASLQGSAVTGKSFNTGKAFGPHSDFDVAVASDSLFLRAKKLGIEIGTNPARIGPLTPKQIKQLGLDKVHRRLERNAEREVNFMIFKSQERALQWSADTIKF